MKTDRAGGGGEGGEEYEGRAAASRNLPKVLGGRRPSLAAPVACR